MITRGYRHRQHVIAANVDQVLIVSALAEPGLKLGLIDRYLVSAEIGGVRRRDRPEQGRPRRPRHSPVGDRPVHPARLRDDRDLGRRRPRPRSPSAPALGGVTAVTGQSGVGKSSLLNVIQPGLNLKVREVSDWTFKGKHTTTDRRADRPGQRRLRRRHARPAPVRALGRRPGRAGGLLRRVPPFIPHCRFPDCSHTHETGCAVKDAVHWGQIHAGRYESYRKLYEQQPLEGD